MIVMYQIFEIFKLFEMITNQIQLIMIPIETTFHLQNITTKALPINYMSMQKLLNSIDSENKRKIKQWI